MLLGYKTLNEHLYIYSALVISWTNNESRHIANAFNIRRYAFKIITINFLPYFSKP